MEFPLRPKRSRFIWREFFGGILGSGSNSTAYCNLFLCFISWLHNIWLHNFLTQNRAVLLDQTSQENRSLLIHEERQAVKTTCVNVSTDGKSPARMKGCWPRGFSGSPGCF